MTKIMYVRTVVMKNVIMPSQFELFAFNMGSTFDFEQLVEMTYRSLLREDLQDDVTIMRIARAIIVSVIVANCGHLNENQVVSPRYPM